MSVAKHFDEPHQMRSGMKCLFCGDKITKVPYVIWDSPVAVIFICNSCCLGNTIDSLMRDILEARHPDWFASQRLPLDDDHPINRFINDCIKMAPYHSVTSEEISDAWNGWAPKNDPHYKYQALTAKDTGLFSYLVAIGFSTWLTSAGPRWKGMILTDAGRRYAEAKKAA